MLRLSITEGVVSTNRNVVQFWLYVIFKVIIIKEEECTMACNFNSVYQ